MRLSMNFLKDYLDINISTSKIATDMTKIGNEYETIEQLTIGNNLVVGKVISCIDHPDSDHLHVCQVDVQDEILEIVCGAPNVREGIKVIVAKVGAKLKDITIKQSKIRGIVSNGMLCSLEELGIDHKYLSELERSGIQELPNEATIGMNAIEYLKMNDEIVDFELTANRGDLLSILGMAYEIGALYNLPVKEMDTNYNEIKEDINNSFHLDIQTTNCPLFLVKKALHVQIGPSPTFIKNRLIASGIRPINNVVDISNYVMLETGQPLHFYDADSLGNKIIVRMAKNEEKIKTLDSNERILNIDDIVIASDNKAIGLAGVMGGYDTEITENTKNIIIESALFNSTNIRCTSKRILRSESSIRFEKGIDPNRTYLAIKRSCYLLKKYANADILSGTVEHKNIDLTSKKINIKLSQINQLLGLNIPLKDVINIFERLGFNVENKAEYLIIDVPKRRLDINICEDLIEEVGRFYGVENMQGKLPITSIKTGTIDLEKRVIRDKLISLGLSELMTYSLNTASNYSKFNLSGYESINILDPMTNERTTLRYSLIPSLVEVYQYNKARNLSDVALFEIGRGFYKINNNYFEEDKVAILLSGNYYREINNNISFNFYHTKGIIEDLLDYLGYKNIYDFKVQETKIEQLHPSQSANIIINNQIVGFIGRLHPNYESNNVYVAEINLDLLKKFSKNSLKFKNINKYPKISKDMAFILDKSISAGDVINTIKKCGGKLLTNVSIFDIYRGESIGFNNKSLGFNLTFESIDRTLTDEEINVLFNKIIKQIEKEYQGQLRNN